MPGRTNPAGSPEEGLPEEDADGGEDEFLLPDIPLETHRKRIATVIGAVLYVSKSTECSSISLDTNNVVVCTASS